ncbi:hypothetical protein [Nocardia sputorum]|uniref:hypothetical protein n=1 Tax=Nocardia sputorum TaxID=2984338 RepID=UPI0024927064|nr:hypothetical protein [Nocardia sputorum]
MPLCRIVHGDNAFGGMCGGVGDDVDQFDEFVGEPDRIVDLRDPVIAMWSMQQRSRRASRRRCPGAGGPARLRG